MKHSNSGLIPATLLCMGILACLCCTRGYSQNNPDTLRLSLQEAENRFLTKNLSLLAARYNIDASKALVEQARLWDNPVLVTDQNIYAGNKFFAHGKDASGQLQGQYFIQVQQLIKTAGKRSKWIAMASTNAKISELQFKELMRNLRYSLRSDYYTIGQLTAVHELYERALQEMQQLLKGMEAQLQAGNIAQKDYLRIQAVILSLQQDQADNDRQLADTESELRTILQLGSNQVMITDKTESAWPLPDLTLNSLLDSARQNNSAYAIEQTLLLYQQQNLAYQKALRAPDLTIGPEYDHNSNYAPHYVGLSVSLPLNLFNKNQGNIKSAQFSVKQEETTLQQLTQQLENAIQNAMNKLYLTSKLNSTPQQQFYRHYEQLFRNVTDSYRQRQISLLEFIDFFDTYRDIQLKACQQKLNLQLAKEELNYLTGTQVIQ